MTASIRADCPRCGPVETPIVQSQLRLLFTATSSGAVVDFRCPDCDEAVTTAVGDRATRLLLHAGVPVVGGSPADARHANAGRRGPEQ
jgi:predicted RNA-binding Zn-ribbon protein involved in translation (DUF1610 family)